MSAFQLASKAFIKARNSLFRKISQPYYLSSLLGIDCHNSQSVHLYGNVDFGSEPWIITLGENVYLTDGVKFITHDGGTLLYRKDVPDLEVTKPIVIGNNVYVGNNAILLPGIKIGDNVVIGAGAVVTKDVPSNEVWAGVPAKKIKDSSDYLKKLQRESLHLGHLKAKEKDVALRKYYGRS